MSIALSYRNKNQFMLQTEYDIYYYNNKNRKNVININLFKKIKDKLYCLKK